MLTLGLAAPGVAAPKSHPAPPGTLIPAPDDGVVALQAMLSKPENQIDLAEAKVTIDHMLDPSVDELGTLAQVDEWAKKVRARIPPGTPEWDQLVILSKTLYEPGPWNDHHRFNYAFDDPFGKDLHTSELSHYLATRRGNCVSMPIFFAILAQKIGLTATLAVAPNHILVKFKHFGQWMNIEATSGGWLKDSQYQEEFDISPVAMQSGIYLRPLSPREAVVAMATPLLDEYKVHHTPAQQLAIANLALTYYPMDIVAMLNRALAYDDQVTLLYRNKYPDPALMSPAQQADYQALMGHYFETGNQIKALGWHQRSQQQDADYVQRIQQAKAADTGG